MDEKVYQTYTLTGFDADTRSVLTRTFRGRLLGEGSTGRDSHSRLVHPPGMFAAQGDPCRACRWFEVRIYAAAPDDDDPTGSRSGWYVETVGRSVVPGEVDRRQVRHLLEPRRVVAVLVQSRGEDDEFIPAPSRHALDQAAERDPRLAPVIDSLVVHD